MKGTTPTGIPESNTLEVTANVLIPNGATVAIGGITDIEVAPGTKESPSVNSTTPKELLVILTPHLWKPTSSSNAEGYSLMVKPDRIEVSDIGE
jgi:Flp pilus assembly secretin CpaC